MTARADLDDLLIIGGLTVDRFADDRLAPGGSVLHASRAAGRNGLATSVVTVAGSEDVAEDGLRELRRLSHLVEVAPAEQSIRFRHGETPGGVRRLWLESVGAGIVLTTDVIDGLRIRAILFAPVAAELDTLALGAWDSAWVRGAILQGWLRRAAPGKEVTPIAPADLADDLVAALGTLDVLVASREDLLAAAERPFDQVRDLRDRVGPSPLLIVTDGPDGVWIDDGTGPARHLPAPWRVDGVPTVGAGDAFAALFVAHLGAVQPARNEIDVAAREAMRGVAEMLEARR